MSAPVHMAHETGAWNLGVAAAFLAVAAAPRLAAGALPFLGTFTRAARAGDPRRPRRRPRAPPTARRSHLLLLAGLALVATVAWRGAPAPVGGGRRAPRVPA